MEDKKMSYLKSLKIDYCLFNEIESILNDNLSNHVKVNLISDVIKQEVDKILEEVYEEGYYQGQMDEEEKHGNDEELEKLQRALEEIKDIVDFYQY